MIFVIFAMPLVTCQSQIKSIGCLYGESYYHKMVRLLVPETGLYAGEPASCDSRQCGTHPHGPPSRAILGPSLIPASTEARGTWVLQAL
jgi:hypothetical protein